MKKLSIAMAVVFAISGCSTASKNIMPQYVTPLQYQTHDCQQLEAEAHRLGPKIAQLGGRLDAAASNDVALTTVSLILFWPAAFFIGGTKEQEAEYGRLTGEYEAIQKALITKKCDVVLPDLPKPTVEELIVADPTFIGS